MIAPGIPCFATPPTLLGNVHWPMMARTSPCLAAVGSRTLPHFPGMIHSAIPENNDAQATWMSSPSSLTADRKAISIRRGPQRLRALMKGAVWRYLAATMTMATVFLANAVQPKSASSTAVLQMLCDIFSLLGMGS
jgi:hypothetical protein